MVLCQAPQSESLIAPTIYTRPALPSSSATAVAVIAEAEVAARRFAGIAWQVEHTGHVVECGARGYVDHALSCPLPADAIYRIYSMTKPVVSLLACMLVDEGKLALDTPVSHYLSEFGKAGVLHDNGTQVASEREATIEDLLTHKAGLSYDFMPGCPVAALYREAGFFADGSRSLEALALELAALPLARQPGAGWYYSYGTDVLAAIVQSVLDRPLGECLQRHLFGPLGMTETGFGVSPDARNRIADVFGARDLNVEFVDDNEPQVLNAMHVELSYPSDRADTFARGGLGLFSTRDDYACFIRCLVDGVTDDGERLISQVALDDAWRNRLTASQRPIRIAERSFPGYGWGLLGRVMVDTDAISDPISPGEGGWSGAASTWFWVDRKRKFTGVILAQYLGAQVHLGELMQSAAYSDYIA